MKTLPSILRLAAALALTASCLAVVPAADAAVSASIDFNYFQDRLAPYGQWTFQSRFGWVWHPRDVDVSWRPYTRGHWILLEDSGWYWDSDFDWGWATFHYGRWDYDPDLGWIWIPGYDWAPAWVAWRTGDDFIGWAPLPPEVGWDDTLGLDWAGFDVDAALFEPRWVFVRDHDFLARRIRDVAEPDARNGTILTNTKNATRYTVIDHHVADRSIAVERVEHATNTHIAREKLNDVSSPAEIRHAAGVVSVFRPAIKRTETRAAPPSIKETKRIKQAEIAAMQERHAAEQRELQARQEEESRSHAMPAEQLQRQHEAEQRALAAQHAREERQLGISPPPPTSPQRRDRRDS